MSLLEQIIAKGNRSFDTKRADSVPNWITCADGFKLSVIAGEGAYCSPRPDRYAMKGDTHTVTSDFTGPYLAVEVGYPTQRPEPWHCSKWNEGYDRHEDHDVCDGWQVYAEGDDYENTSVYGYVPVDMVRRLVESHGGEA